MMNTLGWRKIYLAYGMIFFSLGLIGRLSQPGLWGQLRAKAGQLWQDIRIYADLPISPVMEIPVFQELRGGRQIYFFYLNHLREDQEDVWQGIREALNAYSYPRELVLYPLAEEDMIGRLLTTEVPSSAILIGLRLDTASSRMQAELNFKLPETVRLQQTLAGLGELRFNQVQIRKFRQNHQEIYQLQWFSDASRVAGDLQQVLRRLLDQGEKRV